MPKIQISAGFDYEDFLKIEAVHKRTGTPKGEIIVRSFKFALEKGCDFEKIFKQKYVKEKKNVYEILIDIWNKSGKKIFNNQKFITKKDAYRYFLKTGKTENTARQYVEKKVGQNPLFIGLKNDELKKVDDGYVIIENENLSLYKDVVKKLSEICPDLDINYLSGVLPPELKDKYDADKNDSEALEKILFIATTLKKEEKI